MGRRFCRHSAVLPAGCTGIRVPSRNSRTGTPALIRCHYQKQAVKPPIRVITLRPYPFLPVTLGDYLRKTRLDLNLTQGQVAKDILQTSVDNVRNWEANRGEISLRFRPRVIEFICYCPCNVSLLIGQKLKERRENFGLSVKELARLLNVDPCTIASWERCEHQPSQKSLKIIEGFLKSVAVDKIFRLKFTPTINKEKVSGLSFPNYVLYAQNWSIGRKIVTWRLSVGLSQRQLAKLSRISLKSIYRWEKEKRTPKPEYQNQLLKTIVSYVSSVTQTN